MTNNKRSIKDPGKCKGRLFDRFRVGEVVVEARGDAVDGLIVGGGHHGPVTAGYLARRGLNGADSAEAAIADVSIKALPCLCSLDDTCSSHLGADLSPVKVVELHEISIGETKQGGLDLAARGLVRRKAREG